MYYQVLLDWSSSFSQMDVCLRTSSYSALLWNLLTAEQGYMIQVTVVVALHCANSMQLCSKLWAAWLVQLCGFWLTWPLCIGVQMEGQSGQLNSAQYGVAVWGQSAPLGLFYQSFMSTWACLWWILACCRTTLRSALLDAKLIQTGLLQCPDVES